MSADYPLIVVGVDASTGVTAVLDAAVRAAIMRGAALRIVHAYPDRPHPDHAVPRFGPTEPDPHARAILDSARVWARRHVDDLPVEIKLVRGMAATVLVDEAEDADLLVIGCYPDRHEKLHIGSVATQVAAHASGPVLVVRGVADRTPPASIVVGVDDPDPAPEVVEFAFEEAALRHSGVLAIHVAPPDLPEHAAREIHDALDRWAAKYRHVHLWQQVIRADDATSALVQASVNAALVVIGPRASGLAPTMRLGSTGLALLHRSGCPVAVIHPRRGARGVR